jgi:ribose transport system substrate-binding protein
LIAPTSSDASLPAIEDAVQKGIPMVTVDNVVNSKKPTANAAAENLKGGVLARGQVGRGNQGSGQSTKRQDCFY